MTTSFDRSHGSSTSGPVPPPMPSVAEMQRLAAGVLSLPSRLGHVALLLAALTMTGITGGLLLTEASLPARTQAALAVMVAIGLSWSGFAVWVLTRRRVLLARHRVVAGRMAVAYSGLFLVVVSAAAATGQTRLASGPAIALIATGGVLLAAAVVMLLRARRQVRELTARRDALDRQLAGPHGHGVSG